VRRIARLDLPPVRLADCGSAWCRKFGLTGEVHSTPDYARTQAWAAAFAGAGFGGVRYLLRHDPSQRLAGVALFGPAGAPGWPYEAGDPIGPAMADEVWRRFGLRIMPAP
jgi:hypothetical protein